MSEDTQPRREEVADVIGAMKHSFEEMLREALAGVSGDVREYGLVMGREFAANLWAAYRGDAEAERNVAHLRAQAIMLAAKHQLALNHEVQERVKEIVAHVARFAIGVLIAAI